MNDKLERIDSINTSPELHYSLPPEAQSFMREPETNFQIHLLIIGKSWSNGGGLSVRLSSYSYP